MARPEITGKRPETGGKLAYTIPEFVRASGLSRSGIYLAIRSGALRARKYGARTIILGPDARRFLRSLPALAIEGHHAPAETQPSSAASKLTQLP
jgi:hypothetical protein